LLLSSEHRAAAASPPVYLELVTTDAETAHLQVVAPPDDQQAVALSEQVLGLLADGQVHTRTRLREQLGVKNERLGQTLESMERDGQLRRTPTGWQRAS
ncbi:MAG: hypothetical protein EA424_09165, partial [Planctomycetaceae bacterium]